MDVVAEDIVVDVAMVMVGGVTIPAEVVIVEAIGAVPEAMPRTRTRWG